MKRFVAILLLILLCMQTGMAERSVFAGDDGTLFYGMLVQGKPVGFVASRSPGGERMSFGILTEKGWQGSLYTIVLDETGAFTRLLIGSYADGVCQAALHCRADGTLSLFSYEDGEIASSIVRTAEQATAYTIRNGEAQDPQPVAAESLTGALSAEGVSLHVQLLENRTVYCVQDAQGNPYVAVQVYGDGSVAANRYFDGEALTYSAAENTCTVGVMQDGAWESGAVVIAADGSKSRIP